MTDAGSIQDGLNIEDRRDDTAADQMKLTDLRAELKRRNLKTSGNKDELRRRLKAALLLEDEREEERKDEDEDERDDEDVESHEEEDDDNDDDTRYALRRNANVARRHVKYLPSFKDVEESMMTFSGDDKRSIKRWLEDFEETAEMCEWTDIQKVMYAKRLLRGSARLFVNYEKCCKRWKDLKGSLAAEFSTRVSSHKIHKELLQKKKRHDESYQEYIYKMLEIASQADVEIDSVIRYVIDGIQDDESNKVVLYGARSIRELKNKFATYEEMKTNSRARTRRTEEKMKKPVHAVTSEVPRCFNCGLLNHVRSNCPAKDRGTKCFKCNEYGHIASKCPKKPIVGKDSYSVTQQFQGKHYKEVKISGHDFLALIDTGSDLCLMRAEQYVKIGAPRLTNKEIRFRGVGSDNNKTLGEFSTDIVIDNNSYPITIHVVSDTLMQHSLLIGVDFLNTVEVNIKEGKISILKSENNISPNSEVPEIFKIDTVHEVNKVDLSYVTSNKCRSTLENLIESYNPVKQCEVNVKMSLILKDNEPVYQRPRRLSPPEKEEVNGQIDEWLREGIIQPSLSEYASPIVLVKKKNGCIRICIDYRLLNRKIVKDRYPLPLIEDQLDSLQGAKVFSTLDLKNGFFHVSLDEDSRKFTAFVTPNGQYEFLKVPFGLCNSPAVFQKFVNAVFKDQIAAKVVLVYMDDLILPSADCESGLRNLQNVLDTASRFGLIINWEKCRFLQTRIEYLGHIVENGNIRPSEHKTDAVMKFPRPASIKTVQSFLGLTGYFRKFINQYSIIARPLTNLLRANAKFEFSEKEEQAFVRLKAILCDKPVLRLYRIGAYTELHTDASMYGYGAMLMQRDNEDGAVHPVYYASGKTTPAEEKYTSYELEVLAIIKSLKKFRVYLLGIQFKIITDCQAFAMTMRKKDLCVRVARWALLLEEFQYEIEHRPGRSMLHVDALSRNALPSCMLVSENEEGIIARLKAAQRKDEDIQRIFYLTEQGKADGYSAKGGLLWKIVNEDTLLIVPKVMQSQIIRKAHERGHFSINKTEALVKKDYWFRNMRAKIEKIVRNCVSCILAEKKQGKQEGFLNPIDKGELPLDTYHIDHLGPIPTTKKNYRYIFAIVDAFSKFTWLYATKTTNTSEVLNWLRKQSAIFGNPRKIISDRGTAFTSREFEDYCKEEGVQHTLITTGIPRANGQVERINRTLIPLLTKLSAPKPHEWHRYLEKAQKYLNATPSRSTGASPFNLLFGTEIRMKDDPKIREIIESEGVTIFQEERDEIRRQARESISKVQQENKNAFNAKRKEARKYNEDDLVAIRRTQLGPGLKFSPKYLGPYRVITAMRNDRYIVQKVGECEGPQQTSTAADSMKPWIDSVSENSSDSESAEDI